MKYSIIKQIGTGSFSTVYLCKRPQIESPILLNSSSNSIRQSDWLIIKEININTLLKRYTGKMKAITEPKKTFFSAITPYGKNKLQSNELEYYYKRLKDIIESEIEVLSNLDHPNIVSFFDYSTLDYDYIYRLEMEYCSYGDLYSLLKQKQLSSLNFFGAFTRDIISGLDFIHQNGLIHRDIKLQNILVSQIEPPCFKISDFGFCCYDLSKNNNASKQTTLAKKYFKICGTPYYMAPEIIRLSKIENICYNSSVDIWSFGICLYELITADVPFPEITNIPELQDFYHISQFAQEAINERITVEKLKNNICVELLQKILIVESNNRPNTKQLLEFISDNQVDFDAIVLSFSNFKKRRRFFESWDFNSVSLIKKVSVEGSFMDWLMGGK